VECTAGYLERVARLPVLGKDVATRARIDFASALLAPNVPNARDGVAVLAFTNSGATAAVVEIDKGINTLVTTMCGKEWGALRLPIVKRTSGSQSIRTQALTRFKASQPFLGCGCQVVTR
jgi:hypothetical protein